MKAAYHKPFLHTGKCQPPRKVFCKGGFRSQQTPLWARSLLHSKDVFQQLFLAHVALQFNSPSHDALSPPHKTKGTSVHAVTYQPAPPRQHREAGPLEKRMVQAANKCPLQDCPQCPPPTQNSLGIPGNLRDSRGGWRGPKQGPQVLMEAVRAKTVQI